MKSIEWFVDGYPLRSGLVRDVENRAGWHRVVAPKGEDLTVPNRSGVIWTPKKLSPGSVSLQLWLVEANEQDLLDAWDELLRRVTPTMRQIVLQKRHPLGEVRNCRAYMSGGIAPVMVGRSGMRAQLTFTIPSGYWESQETFSFSTAAGPTLPQTLSMPSLSRSTAPMENGLYTIHGPITNPVMSWGVPAYGISESVKYNGTVPAGASLSLDSGTWEITGSGFSANPAALVPTGSRIMTLAPSSAPVLGLHGVGGGATTRLEVSSKAAFIA